MKKLAFAFLLSLGLAQQVYASTITIDFAGQVDGFSDPHGLFGNPIQRGDVFTGSYSYDTDLAASNFGNPGEYLFANSAGFASLTVDGITYPTDLNNHTLFVGIENSGSETLVIDTPNVTPASGVYLDLFDISFSSTQTLGDAVPTSAPPFENGADLIFDLAAGNTRDTRIGASLSGVITSAQLHQPTTDVPEPATMTLLGVSLFGGLAARRKARV